MPPWTGAPCLNPHQPYRRLRQGHTLIFLDLKTGHDVADSRDDTVDKSSCDNYSCDKNSCQRRSPCTNTPLSLKPWFEIVSLSLGAPAQQAAVADATSADIA
jgi:hypothetical protein